MVVSDIAQWPTWTESMERVQPDSMCRFGLESKARVKQPGMPAMTWTVTRWEPGSRFDWVTKSLGVTIVASHAIERADSGSRLTLSVEGTGWLAPIASLATSKRTRRYVQMELDGLRRAAEAMRAAG